MQDPKAAPPDRSLAGFCQRQGLSLTTGYKELNSGRLRGKKVGRRTIITPHAEQSWEDDLPDYLETA